MRPLCVPDGEERTSVKYAKENGTEKSVGNANGIKVRRHKNRRKNENGAKAEGGTEGVFQRVSNFVKTLADTLAFINARAVRYEMTLSKPRGVKTS